MHYISTAVFSFSLFWQCRGDVGWRRVLAVVVGKRGDAVWCFVCLFVVDGYDIIFPSATFELKKRSPKTGTWWAQCLFPWERRLRRRFPSRWTLVVGLSRGIRRVLSHGILISIYNFFSLLIYDNDNEQPPIRHLDASSHSSGAVTQWLIILRRNEGHQKGECIVYNTTTSN